VGALPPSFACRLRFAPFQEKARCLKCRKDFGNDLPHALALAFGQATLIGSGERRLSLTLLHTNASEVKPGGSAEPPPVPF